MILYKYRSTKYLDRDLDLLVRNCFWAAKAEDLNDEKEFLFRHETLDKQLDALTTIFHLNPKSAELVKQSIRNLSDTVKNGGVYSLSKSATIPNMWALYASNSKGYCLMYDSDMLSKPFDDVVKDQRFMVKVNYANSVPELNLLDMNNDGFIPKMMATKSKSWEYEQEVRFITNKPGEQKILPSSLKGVVFGSRTEDDIKVKIRKLLVDRDVDFYQIISDPNSYALTMSKIFSNRRKRLLDSSAYTYKVHSTALSDTYSVKSHLKLKDKEAIKDFMVKFKHDNAERSCVIFLYDSYTDLTKTDDDIKYGDYLNDHIIAEMYQNSDEVYILKD